MQGRLLGKDGVYHVYTKSIADFTIFNNDHEFGRMLETIQYYQFLNTPVCFSYFKAYEKIKQNLQSVKKEKIFEIIAYCLMPTHVHLVLTQIVDNGISHAISNILNSYTRYFNSKYNRKGPLWTGRFKNVIIKNDAQLLHLTRYIHLNPVTAYLVERPQDWLWSSYAEYLLGEGHTNTICKFDNFLDIEPKGYREFVENRIDEQRNLAKIKAIALEDP